MEEYAARFMELSQFSSYLIPNIEKKASKFEEGLLPEYLTMYAVITLEIGQNWWSELL